MAWPDKVGIGIACLIVAIALYGLIVLLNGLPPSAPFEFQDWTRFGVGLIKTLFFLALPIWLAARLLISFLAAPPNARPNKIQPKDFPLRLSVAIRPLTGSCDVADRWLHIGPGSHGWGRRMVSVPTLHSRRLLQQSYCGSSHRARHGRPLAVDRPYQAEAGWRRVSWTAHY